MLNIVNYCYSVELSCCIQIEQKMRNNMLISKDIEKK